MKKTDRPKDWPLVNALAIQAYYAGDPEAVLHLRDPEILREAWQNASAAHRDRVVRERPLLTALDAVDDLRALQGPGFTGGAWELLDRGLFR